MQIPIPTLARRSEAMLIENYLYNYSVTMTTIVWRHSSVTMATMTVHCPDQWKIPYSETCVACISISSSACALNGP